MNHSSVPSSREMLMSWKEIASYLRVDIKTAQRYEKKFGLPVHRRTGFLRSRVFAYTDEIKRWENRNSRIKSKEQRNIRFSKLRPYLLLLAVAVLATFLYFGYSRIAHSAQPANFTIDQSTLIILSKIGRELWPFDTHLPNLWDEKEYREGFQRNKEISDELRRLPVLIIKDINHDGLNEVLFSIQTTDGLKAGVLYCFDSRGTKLWDFKAGREIQLGSRVYSRDFVIISVDIVDLNNDGDVEIVVISHVREEIPTQVAILNLKGNLIREYWNVGQFNDYAFEDLNGDGRKEILLAGQNNAYDRPCLVVLDFISMKGISPSKPNLECPGLEKGSEIYYLLFALTELDELFKPRIALCKIDILSNRRIQVRTTFSYVMYELNFLLKPEDVTLSDTFARRYNDAYRGGKLRIPLDEKNKVLLQKKLWDEIDYYDGNNWTRGGAMSNKGRTSI
jgi:hypothetical protein